MQRDSQLRASAGRRRCRYTSTAGHYRPKYAGRTAASAFHLVFRPRHRGRRTKRRKPMAPDLNGSRFSRRCCDRMNIITPRCHQRDDSDHRRARHLFSDILAPAPVRRISRVPRQWLPKPPFQTENRRENSNDAAGRRWPPGPTTSNRPNPPTSSVPPWLEHVLTGVC